MEHLNLCFVIFVNILHIQIIPFKYGDTKRYKDGPTSFIFEYKILTIVEIINLLQLFLTTYKKNK
jgi:hypothetical protein